MRIALTRSVPAAIVRCELTHLERTPVDVIRASAQHEQYEEALRALGYTVQRLPETPELADSVFVEDTALVLDELAVITRPGAESRREETDTVAGALARYRPLRTLTAPATLDGGDVLRINRDLYVGLSSRTNEEGARQLADVVKPLGYRTKTVTVRGCLHLKSAVTALEDELIFCNAEWIAPSAFDGRHALAVPAGEPFAANVLRVGNAVVCAAEHVRTIELLCARGYAVHPVDVSELAKAEGGVTCCSLLIEQSSSRFKERDVAAYVIASVEIQDPVRYEEYRKGVLPTITAYGGRFLARGGTVHRLEGDWAPKRLVIVEFPTVERAKAWWNSPEYADLKTLRQATSAGSLVVLEGVES